MVNAAQNMPTKEGVKEKAFMVKTINRLLIDNKCNANHVTVCTVFGQSNRSVTLLSIRCLLSLHSNFSLYRPINIEKVLKVTYE